MRTQDPTSTSSIISDGRQGQKKPVLCCARKLNRTNFLKVCFKTVKTARFLVRVSNQPFQGTCVFFRVDLTCASTFFPSSFVAWSYWSSSWVWFFCSLGRRGGWPSSICSTPKTMAEDPKPIFSLTAIALGPLGPSTGSTRRVHLSVSARALGF